LFRISSFEAKRRSSSKRLSLSATSRMGISLAVSNVRRIYNSRSYGLRCSERSRSVDFFFFFSTRARSRNPEPAVRSAALSRYFRIMLDPIRIELTSDICAPVLTRASLVSRRQVRSFSSVFLPRSTPRYLPAVLRWNALVTVQNSAVFEEISDGTFVPNDVDFGQERVSGRYPPISGKTDSTESVTIPLRL